MHDKIRDGRMFLRVAGGASLLHLPAFVAEAKGYYREVGVDVSFLFSAAATREARPADIPWSSGIEDVFAGRADIVIANISMALRSPDAPDRLVPFAYCSQQCRYVLLARPGSLSATFHWTDLIGKTVVYPSDAPTPWVAFREVLHRQRVPLDEVQVVVGFTARQAVAEFALGVGDYLYSAAEHVQTEGLVEMAAMADVLGPVPWSVFLVPRSAVDSQGHALRAFRGAVGRALVWVQEHSERELAELARHWFPDVDTSTLVIGRYKALQMWPASPALPRGHVKRWQEILLRWGMVRSQVPFDNLVILDG